MNNVVVLGDGALGSEIVKQSGWDCKSRKLGNFDIKCFDKLLSYSIVVNCIANTDTYAENKQEHWDVNYKFVYELALFCNKHNIKLVHISSDFIYANNEKAEPNENDVPVHSENWYSLTKLLADNVIELISKDYLICRTTHKAYPWPYEKAFVNRIGNFDYTPVIANLIIKLINKKAKGIYNVGTKTKSIYDLAKQSKSNVIPVQVPLGFPISTCMDISKMEEFLK